MADNMTYKVLANDGESGRRFPVKYSCIGDNRKRLCVFVTVVVLACSVVILAVVLINKNNSSNPGGGTTENQPKQSAIVDGKDVEGCPGTVVSKPFPDVGYALVGYNIIKGYPRSYDHDPGFTYPIFNTVYSRGYQSDDCRFNIPNGLVIFPHISCKTSFSSSIIETTSTLSRSLSKSANVEFGIPLGFSFKASAQYKSASSSISSGNNIYIISTAKCEYYYSKLKVTQLPDFSSDFIYWMNILNTSNETEVYMKFFDYFGTHFFKEVTFGASYSYEYKMSSQSYKSALSKGINIESSASYSGRFSLSGGFTLDESERQLASNFKKLVKTRTITKGAPPPANGDAMTWASTIKNNPVPIKYTLTPIANLFTARHMASLNVNFEQISKNLKKNSDDYCKYLLEKGLLDSCEHETEQIVLKSTRLWNHDKDIQVYLYSECIYECMETNNCFAVSFLKKKRSATTHDRITCYIFTNGFMKGTFDEQWETTLFIKSRTQPVEVRDTAIRGEFRDGSMVRAASEEECMNRCRTNSFCSAFSYCTRPDKTRNCQLFASKSIDHFFKEPYTKSYILVERPHKNTR